MHPSAPRLPHALPVLVALVAGAPAPAALRTFDIAGFVSVGGGAHAYVGTFAYDDAASSSTVYFPGDAAPVQQGFRSAYAGALRTLSIQIAGTGDAVIGAPGPIHVNDIQQAENGAQVPEGLSLQAYAGGVQGDIDGVAIDGIYLAFLPVASSFTWDALDAYFDGNAEQILQEDPAALPPTIDPLLTGTAMPDDLAATFSSGLFIGIVHGGTTTLGSVTTFAPHVAAPEDLDGDGAVGFADLLLLLGAWGACPPPPAACAADLDGSGAVDFADLLALLAAWSS